MKSKILLFLLVSSFVLVGATSSVFADRIDVFLAGTGPDDYGVSFLDAEKNSGSTDNNFCWAAPAANILAWTGWDATFNGDEDAIFANFQANWTGLYGSWTRFGLEWWFTGGVDPADPAWVALQAMGSDIYTGGGGYYSEAEYNANVRIWEDLSVNPDVTHTDAELRSFIDNGYATELGLYYSVCTIGGGCATAGAHAVTLFGYQYDTLDQNYLGIWISDSDNDEYNTLSPTPNTLNLYELDFRHNWGWYLPSTFDPSDPQREWWIGTMSGLLPNEVPEPGTLILLGSGLLGITGFYRKRILKK